MLVDASDKTGRWPAVDKNAVALDRDDVATVPVPELPATVEIDGVECVSFRSESDPPRPGDLILGPPIDNDGKSVLRGMLAGRWIPAAFRGVVQRAADWPLVEFIDVDGAPNCFLFLVCEDPDSLERKMTENKLWRVAAAKEE